MQSVALGSSGLANLSLVPNFLFALAAPDRRGAPKVRHALALLVGSARLVALFWRRGSGTMAARPLPGSRRLWKRYGVVEYRRLEARIPAVALSAADAELLNLSRRQAAV
jgi:hypothetical protein